MGLKILRVSFLFYDQIMQKLVFEYKREKIPSYIMMLQKIFDQFYMYFDSFSYAMRSISYEAEEVFYDFKDIQYQWAIENGCIITENWKEEILLRQIQKSRPDIIYFQDINALPMQILKDLKKRFSFLKLVIIFRGYPLVNKQLFQKLALADILLVGSPKLLDPCKKQGLSPYLLYHSFDPRILKKIDIKQETIPFSFCGSSGFGNYFFHLSRYYFLNNMMKKTDLQAWIEENETVKLSIFKAFQRKIIGQIYPFLFALSDSVLQKIESNRYLPKKFCYSASLVIQYKKDEKSFSYPKYSLSSLYPDRCSSPLFGIDLYKRLQSSNISLNKHALVAAPYVDNLRLFDATGVGSCLLTERGENMGSLFIEDEEVVCYSSKEECIEKLNYLKNHDEFRLNIARKGHNRTLKDHNPKERAIVLDKIIKQKLGLKDG